MRAFEASPGASKDNFVKLSDLRARVGGTRADQDAAIRQLRLDGKLSLEVHEGNRGTTTPAERAAAITEGGARYIYAFKR